jgi:hypothetical protein
VPHVFHGLRIVPPGPRRLAEDPRVQQTADRDPLRERDRLWRLEIRSAPHLINTEYEAPVPLDRARQPPRDLLHVRAAEAQVEHESLGVGV